MKKEEYAAQPLAVLRELAKGRKMKGHLHDEKERPD